MTLNKHLISKSFHGKTGSAYLFNNVYNVFRGPESEKDMMTGKHIVCDIYCNTCKVVIGWTYVRKNYSFYLVKSLPGGSEIQGGKVHN